MSDSVASTTTRTIAVSGSSGLVGRALCDSLVGGGDVVKRIVRREPRSYEQEIQWDADAGFVNTSLLEGLDAVVHLAGEGIAEGRWTSAKKQRIRESRIQGTAGLADALAKLDRPPSVLVCASAIGYYGDRGDEFLDETAAGGEGFLPDVCREWEEACEPAREAGIRVVNLRIGIVLSKSGGALAAMLTPFRFGLGGRVGSGRQYWSWVSLADLVGIVQHAISHESLSGPVNAVAPAAPTNGEFTRALGTVLRRPTVFPLPAFAARILLGQMADGLLLSSARVVPRRLTDSGYEFLYPDLADALRVALS